MEPFDIKAWLAGLGLDRYQETFEQNAIEADVLLELTSHDLREMGVAAVGHRRKILMAIGALRQGRSVEQARVAEPTRDSHSPGAERRLLTVMFCDLVGSTALAVRLDPEDLREVIASFHGCVSQVVVQFGGYVAKYMGDGALVYFGYPEAHEDDPERGVRAGLTLIERLRRLDAGSRLESRIGLATGLVVVGDLIGRGEAQERGVVGETPNLAARLQTMAPSNGILVCDTTKRQIGNLFRCRDLGQLQIKGFETPVRAWHVLHETVVDSRFEALRGSLLTPFVARETELSDLLRLWQRATSGAGQVAFLAGEAGIGKSRLVTALRDQLAAEEHTRVRYVCSAHHVDSALHPFITQLEHAAGFGRNDTVQTKVEKLEALLAPGAPSLEEIALLADLLSLPQQPRYTPLTLSPQRRRDKTFEALLQQLEFLAKLHPVLLIFEDLHWMDPTSRDLLDRTIGSISRLPVLLVCTYRLEFAPPWVGVPHSTTITLSRFDRTTTMAMVEEIDGTRALPEGLVAEIFERADGVPLFIEELTKAVLEAGASREGMEKTLARVLPSSVTVPSALHASLMARLDRLGHGPKEIAQIAAAIGREFSYELLAAVVRRDERGLQMALTSLGDAGLVFQRGSPPSATYMFKHALVRDAAYASLLHRYREELHARIAAELEANCPEISDTQPEIIARHFSAARLVERAITYWQLAGERAIARTANLEAIAHLSRGLELVPEIADEKQRLERELLLQVLLIIPHWAAHGWASSGAERAATRALALTRQVGANTPGHVHSLWALAAFDLVRGEPLTGLDVARECLQVAQTLCQPTLIGYARFLMGNLLFWLGRFPAARLQLEQGLAIYDAARDRPEATRYGFDLGLALHSFLGRVLWHLGFYDQARAHAAAALDAAQASRHAFSVAWALAWDAAQYQLLGDARSCLGQAEAAIAVATEQIIPFYGAQGMVLAGWATVMEGDGEAGLARMRAGIDAYRSTGSVIEESHWQALLVDACLATNRVHEGLSVVRSALTSIEANSIRYYEPELNRLKGELLLELDDVQAEDSFRHAVDIARVQQAKMFELRATLSLARLLTMQGKHNEARDCVRPIIAAFGEEVEMADLRKAQQLLG
jgi:class 3 adenylate cyclase/tetratricopeptide (TPR) repeat protein